MKKVIDLYLTVEAEPDFAESGLAFIQPSLEGLGAKVLSMRAHTETHFVDLDAEHPVPWPVPYDEETKSEAPAIPEIEEPVPPVEEAVGTPVVDKALLKKTLFAYRDKLGTDALVALYESHGGGAKTFKDIAEDCYVSMYTAAEEALHAAE